MNYIQEQQFEYIVIGAGIAGLQAGLILADEQKKFVILEASTKLGGRIQTQTLQQAIQKQNMYPSQGFVHNVPNWILNNPNILHTPLDYGAVWIAQQHKYMLKTLKQYQIQTFKHFKNGLIVYGVAPGKYQYHKKLTKHYNQQSRQKIQQFLDGIQKLTKKYNYLYDQVIEKQHKNKLQQYNSFVDKYDNISIQKYVLQQFGNNPLAGQIMNFIQCQICLQCDKVSMLQIFYNGQDSLGIVQQAIGDDEQADDAYRTKSGNGSLIKQMYKQIIKQVNGYNSQLAKNIVRLNEPVVKIETKSGGNKICKVHVQTNQGIKIYTANKILNSIPLGVMNQVQITNLSKGKKMIFDGQQLGKVWRTYMIFKQPFWRNKFNGYGEFSPNFPFNQINQLTPALLNFGMFQFVFFGDKYQRWVQYNPDPVQRFQYLKSIVADMFLNGDRNSPYLQQCYSYTRNFYESQYIRAAFQPMTKMGVYKQMKDSGLDYGTFYENDQNGVYYIGSQFDEQYGSYMEGALRVSRAKTYKLLGKHDPWDK